MARKVELARFDCETLQGLYMALEQIANDPALKAAMDAPVESSVSIFSELRIVERVLSDKSKVLDVELLEAV